MRDEYDFSNAKPVKDVPHLAKWQAAASKGKTRITIMLDNDVIEYFRERAETQGIGYQTMINAALKRAMELAGSGDEPLTVAKLREVLRQELHTA